MQQPPRSIPPGQMPPPQKPNNGLAILGICVLGFIALMLLLPYLNTSRPTAENTINSYPPPGTNDASVGAGSHTNTYFYHTGTPTRGVNGNPYGYDFNPTNGNEIYDEEPVDFCKYFKCTDDFWTNIPLGGYVVECQDGLFSHTGGTKYECSGHGGVKRILYWH